MSNSYLNEQFKHAPRVLIQDAAGRQSVVTQKAFESIYAEKGFVLVTRESVAPAAFQNSYPEPATTPAAAMNSAAEVAARIGITNTAAEGLTPDPALLAGTQSNANTANANVEISAERTPAGKDRGRNKKIDA